MYLPKYRMERLASAAAHNLRYIYMTTYDIKLLMRVVWSVFTQLRMSINRADSNRAKATSVFSKPKKSAALSEETSVLLFLKAPALGWIRFPMFLNTEAKHLINCGVEIGGGSFSFV